MHEKTILHLISVRQRIESFLSEHHNKRRTYEDLYYR
jgi:hypothetical protein